MKKMIVKGILLAAGCGLIMAAGQTNGKGHVIKTNFGNPESCNSYYSKIISISFHIRCSPDCPKDCTKNTYQVLDSVLVDCPPGMRYDQTKLKCVPASKIKCPHTPECPVTTKDDTEKKK